MTREEAIVCLKSSSQRRKWCLIADLVVIREENDSLYRRRKEMAEIALTALRPVSREQVEKVWRGEWMGSADGYADGELVYDTWECSHCGYVIDEEDDPDMLPQFCPKCYAAMTDEAVEMVMERLEALHEVAE